MLLDCWRDMSIISSVPVSWSAIYLMQSPYCRLHTRNALYAICDSINGWSLWQYTQETLLWKAWKHPWLSLSMSSLEIFAHNEGEEDEIYSAKLMAWLKKRTRFEIQHAAGEVLCINSTLLVPLTYCSSGKLVSIKQDYKINQGVGGQNAHQQQRRNRYLLGGCIIR